MPEDQQLCEPGEEDQAGRCIQVSVFQRGEVLKFLHLISVEMENLCKAARTDFFIFFYPFFPILIQFRLQTAIPHTASGHLT